MRRIVSPLILLAAAGLLHAADPGRYGEPLAPGAAVPIADALAAFDEHAGRTGRYSGRITQVCQAKGCWMVLENNGQTARVMFGDHAFAIPKDASGRAEVSGVLSRKHLTQAQVAHLREDARGLAVAAVEYRIVADGVEIEADPAG